MTDRDQNAARELDAIVVGTGFAGLYMLYRLRGLGLSVQVLEAGSAIGRTWFWNPHRPRKPVGAVQ